MLVFLVREHTRNTNIDNKVCKMHGMYIKMVYLCFSLGSHIIKMLSICLKYPIILSLIKIVPISLYFIFGK